MKNAIAFLAFATLTHALSSTASQAQDLQTITILSGVVSFEGTDILQVVGVIADTKTANDNNFAQGIPKLRITFVGGAQITNALVAHSIATAPNAAHTTSNSIQGAVLTNVASLQILGGGAVTVKKIERAKEFVAPPMILPLVEDATFTVTLEPSVDMQNWAPAAPGDYLGSTTHRFFRVRAVQKPDSP